MQDWQVPLTRSNIALTTLLTSSVMVAVRLFPTRTANWRKSSMLLSNWAITALNALTLSGVRLSILIVPILAATATTFSDSLISRPTHPTEHKVAWLTDYNEFA